MVRRRMTIRASFSVVGTATKALFRWFGPGLRLTLLLSFLIALLAGEVDAQQSSTIVLDIASSPNPPTLSDPVTLTATVSPASVTGKVTFYDGTTVVGISSVFGGRAVLVTKALPSGYRSLHARYLGDANFNASTTDS